MTEKSFKTGQVFALIGSLSAFIGLATLSTVFGIMALSFGAIFAISGFSLIHQYSKLTDSEKAHFKELAEKYPNLPFAQSESLYRQDMIIASLQNGRSLVSSKVVPSASKTIECDVNLSTAPKPLKHGKNLVWVENNSLVIYPSYFSTSSSTPLETEKITAIPLTNVENFELQEIASTKTDAANNIDSRQKRCFLFYEEANQIYKLAFSEEGYNVLKQLIPQKDFTKSHNEDSASDDPQTIFYTSSPADEIRKLAKLAADGIITEEEFFQKKKELLEDDWNV